MDLNQLKQVIPQFIPCLTLDVYAFWAPEAIVPLLRERMEHESEKARQQFENIALLYVKRNEFRQKTTTIFHFHSPNTTPDIFPIAGQLLEIMDQVEKKEAWQYILCAILVQMDSDYFHSQQRKVDQKEDDGCQIQ